MKKLLSLLMLLIVTSQQAQTQSGISGDWRAASVLPDGTPDAAIREFNLELEASGTSVKGTVTGTSIVIREGPSTSLFSPSGADGKLNLFADGPPFSTQVFPYRD